MSVGYRSQRDFFDDLNHDRDCDNEIAIAVGDVTGICDHPHFAPHSTKVFGRETTAVWKGAVPCNSQNCFKHFHMHVSISPTPVILTSAKVQSSGKTFSNVYLNMSWIHIISPIGSLLDLKEWLRMVPYNKIIAFSDDLTYVEAVYGHLKMARQNFAIVLAEMIQEGLISESIALDIVQATFHDNPAKVYGMDG